MTIKAKIFGDDPKQALRILRVFQSAATYYLISPFVIYAIMHGLIRDTQPATVIILATLPCIGFYIAIRSGFNLRFTDPSLTIAQMAVATILNMNWVAHAIEARGVFLLANVVILVFGILRLNARQFLLFGLFSLTAYGAMIIYQTSIPGHGLNLQAEILYWLAMLFVYPWFAWMGGYMNRSREQLKAVNAQLAAALEENKAAMKLIEMQATHDELTGIYNRRHIFAAINTEIARAGRAETGFAVLLLDLDFFKKINDTHGHLAGDQVLKSFVDVIQAGLRSTDCFSRYGGEEFCILMPHMNIGDGVAAAERLRLQVEHVGLVEKGPIAGLTVSIGVAEYYPGASVEDLLANADRALYLAKQSGRNCVRSSLLDRTMPA